MASKTFRADNNEFVGVDGSKANKTSKNLSRSKKSKNKKSENPTHIQDIGATRKPIFLTPNAKKAFNHLRQAFIKALILRHFDSKSHIWIETNTLDYNIGKVLSQLSTN